ncbi:restriction endonuclease subunit S [Tannerella forsythia]|uniref:restriction endonuclease subunit S n=1 Tax=Tannerella forsythia TaxID=28112 RepID=UPI0015CF6C14|nr:restriction endonuclease subunit S [Tannerella forsythia]
MEQTKYKYLSFISFKEVSQWYVEYYMNENKIHSRCSLVPLRELIAPKKNVIKKEEYDGSLPIVEKIVFKTGKVVFRDKKVTGMNLYSLQQGDLLISNINFHQGATALNTFGEIAASTHYQPYSTNSNKVDPEFLVMVLRSPYFLSIISGKKAQGIKNESGYNFIGSFSIPLPTLKEQRKIVDLYKAKMEDAEKLALKAEQAEQAVNSYLLDMLDVDKGNEDDEDMLSNAYKYMRFVHRKGISRWDVYNEKSVVKSRLYKNTNLLKVIMEKPQYGAAYSSQVFDGKVRYIRITDINEDGSLNEEKVSAKGYSDHYLLKENDFLIARSGNTVGKTFLYKNKFGKAIFAGYLIRFKLDEAKVIPEYLLAYTKCSLYKEWIKGNMRVSAQPNINSQQYLESPIILPPLDVQKKIVEYIGKQKDEINNLQQCAQTMSTTAIKEFENEIFE